VTRALALLAFLSAALSLGGCCESGRHVYVIDAPDPDLMAALQSCVDSPPCEGGSPCPSLDCRAACARVAALAGDGIAQSALQSCTITLGVDGGPPAQVAIRYNTCGR
jgi:hypothetical protein